MKTETKHQEDRGQKKQNAEMNKEKETEDQKDRNRRQTQH